MEIVNEKISIDETKKEYLNNKKENVIINNVKVDDINNIEKILNDEKIADIDIGSFYKLNYVFRYPTIFLNKDISDNDILLKCDQTYREDMILLFNLGFALSISKDLNGVLKSCTKCIDCLFNKFKDHVQILEIMECLKKTIVLPFEIDDNTAFMYLFSIDYLYIFHDCIKDLYKNNQISKLNYCNLIEKINEN